MKMSMPISANGMMTNTNSAASPMKMSAPTIAASHPESRDVRVVPSESCLRYSNLMKLPKGPFYYGMGNREMRRKSDRIRFHSYGGFRKSQLLHLLLPLQQIYNPSQNAIYQYHSLYRPRNGILHYRKSDHLRYSQ